MNTELIEAQVDNSYENYQEAKFLKEEPTVKSECCGSELTNLLDIIQVSINHGKGVCPDCGEECEFLKFTGPASRPNIEPFQ